MLFSYIKNFYVKDYKYNSYFSYGELNLSKIKRIILDVLKPHKPSILEIANRLGDLEGISGVNISLEEIDTNTHSVKITIEGTIIMSREFNDLNEADEFYESINQYSNFYQLIMES